MKNLIEKINERTASPSTLNVYILKVDSNIEKQESSRE